MMKVLYFGGQKSGKSKLAEEKTILISSSKPFYIATYDNSFYDDEMKERVLNHKRQRESNFITIEETKDLTKIIKEKETYLIDCMSMWLFNNIEGNIDFLKEQISIISKIDANIVFVLNEVTSGVIPFDKESRKFVDMTGIIGQELSKICDEVYEVKFGLENRLK